MAEIPTDHEQHTPLIWATVFNILLLSCGFYKELFVDIFFCWFVKKAATARSFESFTTDCKPFMIVIKIHIKEKSVTTLTLR